MLTIQVETLLILKIVIMKRKVFVHLLTVMMVSLMGSLVSCSSDEDDNSVSTISTPKEYGITIHNIIDKSEISSKKSDGNLYEVYILTEDGILTLVGDVYNKTEKTVKIRPKKEGTKAFCVFLKLGPDSQSAYKNVFFTPEQSYGKIMRYRLYEEKCSDVYITENTTFGQYRTNNILELNNLLESILLQLDD